LHSKNCGRQEEFKVRGFPTICLVDATGKILGRTGYKPGGAEEYVKHLQKLLKKK
jgi:thioredoxin-related protein